jgi:hypothetical protein
MYWKIPAVDSTGGIIRADVNCHIFYNLFFHVCILLELFGDGAMKVVTVVNTTTTTTTTGKL